MTFIIPSPSDLIARYQDLLRPEDPAFGNGIADWTISSEYQDEPQSENGGGPIWGCMCSPSRLPDLVKLQPEDIAAKRAHIILRAPKSIDDIAELHRTVLHELGHVLVAPMGSENREAEENAMHSLDHFFSKLDPEKVVMLRAMNDPEASPFDDLPEQLIPSPNDIRILYAKTRLLQSFQNPMARAYRAKEKTMPDMEENKDKPDKEKPAMQEGGPRDVATIQGEIAKAALAGQPVDELAKELALALVAAGSAAGNGPASVAPPAPEPPTMGMKPEEAYARARTELAQERKEAIEAIIDANPHLTDGQKAMARKQTSVKDARELVATYPRTANQNDPARMGMQGNPKTDPKGAQSPFARMRKGPSDPMVREAIGLPSTAPNEHGISTAPAHVLTFSFAENARSYQDKYRAKMRAQREAAS